MNQEQRKLLASLTGAKAIHCLRLTNNGEAPWTTGPATIYKDNTPLAQQLMTYTSRKNKVDVPVTTATDLNTRKEETEVAREPNISINGYPHTKVKLHGKLTVTSFKDKPVRITITRKTFGTATEATAKGRIVLSNALEDTSLATGRDLWVGWSWPWWWLDVNPLSEITWEATIPAGKMETFEYDWYYYMRH
jgi:hypothetical protein